MQIICPHCGVSNEISKKKKNAFCTFCGSSLNEVIQQLKKEQEPKKTISTESRTQQSSKREQNLPFTDQQQIPSFPRTADQEFKQRQSTPGSAGIPFQSPVDQTTFPQHQISQAKLQFPQIERELKIPRNSRIFHFGRNLILPLVSPDKFDVEWLNSISRVRKKNGNVIHQHFIISRSKGGTYYIEDKSSRWGTWLNRQQIKNKGKFELKKGDKIELMLSKPGVKQVIPFVIIFQME